jgi:hypothetical protein
MKGRRRSQRGSKKRAKRRWGETTCVHGSDCDSELARRPRLLPVRTRAVTLARRSRAHARRSRRASSLVGPACCLRRSPVHVGAGAHLCALEPSRSHTGAKLSPAGAVVCSHVRHRRALTHHCRAPPRAHSSLSHACPQPPRAPPQSSRTLARRRDVCSPGPLDPLRPATRAAALARVRCARMSPPDSQS